MSTSRTLERMSVALRDREGQDETVAAGIELGDSRDDAHVRIAVLQVPAAQQLAIRIDPGGIVQIVVLEEAQQVALAGLDHITQPPGRKGAIAHELDVLDRGLAAFRDLEDEVDAVVRPVDDLGLDADVVAAVAAIDLDDALDIGLHQRTRQRSARFRLDFGEQLLVLDALVALELDAADDRVLDHRHDEAAALPAIAYVGEQAGGEQRLDAFVGFDGIEPLTGADAEIGANRVRLDAAVALDND